MVTAECSCFENKVFSCAPVSGQIHIIDRVYHGMIVKHLLCSHIDIDSRIYRLRVFSHLRWSYPGVRWVVVGTVCNLCPTSIRNLLVMYRIAVFFF